MQLTRTSLPRSAASPARAAPRAPRPVRSSWRLESRCRSRSPRRRRRSARAPSRPRARRCRRRHARLAQASTGCAPRPRWCCRVPPARSLSSRASAAACTAHACRPPPWVRCLSRRPPSLRETRAHARSRRRLRSLRHRCAPRRRAQDRWMVPRRSNTTTPCRCSSRCTRAVACLAQSLPRTRRTASSMDSGSFCSPRPGSTRCQRHRPPRCTPRPTSRARTRVHTIRRRAAARTRKRSPHTLRRSRACVCRRRCMCPRARWIRSSRSYRG